MPFIRERVETGTKFMTRAAGITFIPVTVFHLLDAVLCREGGYHPVQLSALSPDFPLGCAVQGKMHTCVEM